MLSFSRQTHIYSYKIYMPGYLDVFRTFFCVFATITLSSFRRVPFWPVWVDCCLHTQSCSFAVNIFIGSRARRLNFNMSELWLMAHTKLILLEETIHSKIYIMNLTVRIISIHSTCSVIFKKICFHRLTTSISSQL